MQNVIENGKIFCGCIIFSIVKQYVLVKFLRKFFLFLKYVYLLINELFIFLVQFKGNYILYGVKLLKVMIQDNIYETKVIMRESVLKMFVRVIFL